MSMMAVDRQGLVPRHPLDLANCIRSAWTAPKGKKALQMRPVRFSKAAIGKGDKSGSMAFLFCAKDSVAIACESLALKRATDDANEEEFRRRRSDYFRVAGVDLPPFEYANLGLLLPAAFAAHSGILVSGGVACACLPIMSPFQVPQVSPDSWMANKRALAFHRCVVFGVYVQGALALLKFSGGDLVGGTYLALQAAMGAYAITPDGTRFMPSYMMISGFNGILGIIQVFQSFQGVPLHYIPMSAMLPPTLSLLTLYWGWQFCRELRAIGTGMAGDGPQDSCWVKFMGGDIWPISTLSSPPEGTSRAGDGGESSVMGGVISGGGAASRFSAFGGSGHRLGEQ